MKLRNDIERAIYAAAFVAHHHEFAACVDNSNAEAAVTLAEHEIECYRKAVRERKRWDGRWRRERTPNHLLGPDGPRDPRRDEDTDAAAC